ncbi:hypothetical protein [Cryobacterium serini]|uniref:Uncharacterized protein n=1 Tax=Cryobacterium serini TaxID=1259201 RepID=A0A4R9BPC0_9MICO|nr:hypothetical protein [Cryobacterium serini]TFD88394.1 hypothetical protein E3T51_09250 [Cryobacterium serini]
MPTTLRTASFKNINLRERTELIADVPAGVNLLPVVSTEGYVSGDVIYVGTLSREGCERAAVDSIVSVTSLSLAMPLERPHSAFESVWP